MSRDEFSTFVRRDAVRLKLQKIVNNEKSTLSKNFKNIRLFNSEPGTPKNGKN